MPEPTQNAELEAFNRGIRTAVAEIAEVCSLAAIHGPEAFKYAVEQITESASLDYESWLAQARAEALADAATDIKDRIKLFRDLDADPQYLNALNDAWGLVANRRRTHTPPAPTFDLSRLNHGICPGCDEDKFIGHGPLCLDCLTNPPDPMGDCAHGPDQPHADCWGTPGQVRGEPS